MLNNTMGLILTDHDRVHLGDLTLPRALAAVPFGGRYRIVDYMLSNMVNSGISHIGIVAQTKYRSLLDHIGTGASWDLDRMNQGLTILPPYVNSSYFEGEGGDLSGLYEFVRRGNEELVIISDSNFVANVDLEPLVKAHMASEADMTIAYNKDGSAYGSPVFSLEFKDNRLVDFSIDGEDHLSKQTAVGLLVLSRDLLLDLLSKAISRGRNTCSIELLLKKYEQFHIAGFEMKDTILRINSVATYEKNSMRILEADVAAALYDQPDRAIYTKAKNEAAARYEKGSFVSNTVVSDGCVLMGSVMDSILFRGVKIHKHANVEKCILFQDTVVGEGADLHYVITDKDVVIRPGVRLQGQPEYPVVIGKGAVV